MSDPVILHLGLGAFHRAHQAMYLHRLRAAGDAAWQLVAGNIRDDAPDLLRALADQGGRYTLETVSPAGAREYERIQGFSRVLSSPAELVNQGAAAATRIVSFTVTEAGYYLHADGHLDLDHPDIAADIHLTQEGQPRPTLYGLLCAMLAERKRRGNGALTLLCCDNLRHNGARSRAGLLQFLEATGDHELAAWAAQHTRSPNSMVDRITPRPDAALRERVRAVTGHDDPAAVMCERFTQWVIEDDFAAGRPEWERVGVEMVADVEPYEEAKIRILNASHSMLAWAGALIGARYIHDVVRHEPARRWVRAFVSEDVIPALKQGLPGLPIDLEAYCDTVLDRFSNAALGDTVSRVLTDSFAKAAGFIAPTPRERLAQGHAPAASGFAAALFLALLQRWRAGEISGYADQALDADVARAITDDVDPVKAFSACEPLWGSMAGDPRWRQAVSAGMGALPSLV